MECVNLPRSDASHLVYQRTYIFSLATSLLSLVAAGLLLALKILISFASRCRGTNPAITSTASVDIVWHCYHVSAQFHHLSPNQCSVQQYRMYCCVLVARFFYVGSSDVGPEGLYRFRGLIASLFQVPPHRQPPCPGTLVSCSKLMAPYLWPHLLLSTIAAVFCSASAE